jgi:chemotaxis protein methyltransferase CheR/two-component system CheB/CheR fusion protein
MMVGQQSGLLRVVGIGASAGGVDALGQILPCLKPDKRSVYIIALHMAKGADVETILRLLQHCSALPMAIAIQNDRLVADQVFLIPPGVRGLIRAERIRLLPMTPEQISSPSVNALFDSIALDAGSNGVGVILSGAGSDGLFGCQEISAAGGKILVQSLASCQIGGMPAAVIEAGLADEVLLPEQIAQLLNADQLSDHSHTLRATIRNKPLQIPADNSLYSNALNNALHVSVLPKQDDVEILKQVLQSMQVITGCDFSCYKEETLLRRLHRRIEALKITSLADYQVYTQQFPDELRKLQNQFLISLSFFFRDNESFSVLGQHMAALLKNKVRGDSIRIWVPGCASGEECYSLAILLNEILDQHFADFSITVIGSDLNEQALALAERGCYPATAFRDLSPDALGPYFEQNGVEYSVKPYLRQICHFHVEDVARCHLVEKVDVISCRNLLIYMKSELQDKLIRNFHEFLNPGGLLFLGQSETIGLIGNTLFSPLDQYHRVYRRKKSSAK